MLVPDLALKEGITADVSFLCGMNSWYRNTVSGMHTALQVLAGS
jgi:hypothetical protein